MWRINPPNANNIVLNFNYFDTEEGFDKVSVYDGTTLLGIFSGTEIPQELVATSGMMFITWNTNQANNFQGWEAFYVVDNVGVDEESLINGLQVYPNPATEDLTISFTIDEKQDLNLFLSNMVGQVVLVKDYSSFQGFFKEVISLDEIPAGIYMLQINTLKGIETKKIVIK
jgi:hypothetical protein